MHVALVHDRVGADLGPLPPAPQGGTGRGAPECLAGACIEQADHAAAMNAARENVQFLPGHALPATMPIGSDADLMAAWETQACAALGPVGPDLLAHPVLLERVAEVAVLISLFGVGLKLGLPLPHQGWRSPLRLALVSMTISVAPAFCAAPIARNSSRWRQQLPAHHDRT